MCASVCTHTYSYVTTIKEKEATNFREKSRRGTWRIWEKKRKGENDIRSKHNKTKTTKINTHHILWPQKSLGTHWKRSQEALTFLLSVLLSPHHIPYTSSVCNQCSTTVYSVSRNENHPGLLVPPIGQCPVPALPAFLFFIPKVILIHMAPDQLPISFMANVSSLLLTLILLLDYLNIANDRSKPLTLTPFSL